VYASELQEARIIIRDGDTYKFRYAGLRTYLGEDLYYDLRPHLARPAAQTAPPPAPTPASRGDCHELRVSGRSGHRLALRPRGDHPAGRDR
jgi:hypothetical protein